MLMGRQLDDVPEAKTGRWELLRALGAVADSPDAARAVTPALGLLPLTDADHTDAFVLNAPPYAAIYLGPDGALGGEGADRVAGFWRALALTPPSEPDHLSALLGLYASLGEAAEDSSRETTAAALTRSQTALLAEHLWPWLPAYLDAITDLPLAPLTAWAGLTSQALTAELTRHTASPAKHPLPLALREAPAPITAEGNVRGLVDALTTPVISGIILTRHTVALGAGQAQVGHRIGERRFTLRAMLEQDPSATLGWLAQEARRWQARHTTRATSLDPIAHPDSAAHPDPTSEWWADRAAHTGALLEHASQVR
jgi:TorA maturation chaperone TorD